MINICSFSEPVDYPTMLSTWPLLLSCVASALPFDSANIKLGFNESWYPSRRFKGNDIDNPLFLLDRLNPSDGSRSLEYCRRKATCQPLNYTTCLGAKLPYTKTSLDLVPNLETQDRIMVRVHFKQFDLQ